MKGIVLFCALSLTAGCGAQSPNTAPTTYADYLKAASQLTCEATLACCGNVCSDTTDATFYQAAAPTLDAISQGLTGYDGQAAQACLAGLSQHYALCDDPVASHPLPVVCSQVLIQGCTNGRCVAPGKSGEACVPGSVSTCASGLYCNSSTRVCGPLLKAGQACPLGTGCTTGTYCSAGLICYVYGQNGQACDASKLCDPTLVLQCSTTGVCQPQPGAQTIREQLCGPH